MKKLFLFFLPLSFILFLISCQKELSVELNGSDSRGSLQSNGTGECLPKTVQGIYKAGTALVATENYIDVQVNISTIGNYRIFSDTVNGISFLGRGSFTAAGLNTIRLNGTGTPVNGGINNFIIRYDTSRCTIPINIVGSNSTEAQFTLLGAPNSCLNYVLNGVYKVGVPLTTANTVIINVNVTALGTYSLTTPPSNGMTFTGAGSFSSLGQQIVTLTATGTPGIAGSTNIPVTVGTSVCGFEVVVTSTVDYFPRTEGSNWSYQYDGNPNDSLFVRAKPGTVAFAGNIYTVFEAQEDAVTGLYDLGYYRREGGDYHTYEDLGNYFGLDSSSFQDYIFLKDDVALNANWLTAPINGTVTDTSGTTYPVSVRIQFTIEQKDVTVTVGGTSYPNTIVVVEKYQVFDGANWVEATALIGYVKKYYARGVGLIKLEYYYQDGNPNPPVDYVQDIRRYQVF